MAKHVKKSVAPIYLVGVVWLVFGAFFRLHRIMDFLLCGIASVAVFVVARGLFPDKTYEMPGEKEEKQPEKKAEEKPKSTGNPKSTL